ncbi:MAG: hypothetical protein HDQ99_22520 [Lachnospiraceae bacterium]|nr:hypothetical protein [Lachnospiraceae bacterium]
MSEKGKKKKMDSGAAKAAPKQEEVLSFLYMLPETADVRRLSEALDFMAEEAVEIWTEINLMELTLKGGAMTFEDLMPDMQGEADGKLLDELKVKQVYACDYEARDREEVRRIMEALTKKLGGFAASDTEDFRPFLQIGEL